MDFSQFSLHIKDTKVHQFVDYLAEGKIMATRCRKCGAEHYPPAADCAKCMSSDNEWFELSGGGKLVTYTMIHVAPNHFGKGEEKVIPFGKYRYQPCPIGIVEMAKGLKVMGWIPDIPPNDIKVGMSLTPVAETLQDGKVTVTLRVRTYENAC